MSYRSEANRIANKQNYIDLNLSQYPNQLDTRTNNTNLRGFVNIGEGEIPDYVMAEYVNSLNDAVMAVQRSLGETPMVPFDIDSGMVNQVIENNTVADRLSRIEDGLFDVRYGGTGWQFVPNRPTLSGHNHDGLNGHPGKIDLTSEVTGLLPKYNLNLNPNTGLTGADIYVSSQNQLKINEAIDDSLSKSSGGTVSGPTRFTDSFTSRTRLDRTASELRLESGVSINSVSNTSDGRALVYSSAGTTQNVAVLPAQEREHMLFGRYVIGVRIKSSSSISSPVARFVLGSHQQNVLGSEIGTDWNTIYWAFEQDHMSRNYDLDIQKLSSASTVTISIDSVFIEPIHPAVLDR